MRVMMKKMMGRLGMLLKLEMRLGVILSPSMMRKETGMDRVMARRKRKRKNQHGQSKMEDKGWLARKVQGWQVRMEVVYPMIQSLSTPNQRWRLKRMDKEQEQQQSSHHHHQVIQLRIQLLLLSHKNPRRHHLLRYRHQQSLNGVLLQLDGSRLKLRVRSKNRNHILYKVVERVQLDWRIHHLLSVNNRPLNLDRIGTIDQRDHKDRERHKLLPLRQSHHRKRNRNLE
jgi:hypothetical protein